VGSRRLITVLCAVFATPAFAQQPSQPPTPAPTPPQPSADETQGRDLYAAGSYADAAAALQRAHDADPNNADVHFLLAQALRQAGRCEQALPHYKALIDVDPVKADEVRAAMAQCPVAEVTPPPPTPTPPPPPQTIVVHDSSLSTGNILMIGGAGAGLAAGVCLFLAARDANSDAQAAALYKDYVDLSTHSTHLYIASAITAGAGVALAVTTLFRIKAAKEHATEVTVAPTAKGGAIVLEGSW
jgi:tetratricopeptide (TPR) repeat protein